MMTGVSSGMATRAAAGRAIPSSSTSRTLVPKLIFGFPRTVPQIKTLLNSFERVSCDKPKIIQFHIDVRDLKPPIAHRATNILCDERLHGADRLTVGEG